MRKSVYILPDSFLSQIEKNDILSVEEFLFQQHLTQEQWLMRKNGKAELKGVSEYISQRREKKIKDLEKLMINGTATATQIRGYEVLREQQRLENESKPTDEKIEVVFVNGDDL